MDIEPISSVDRLLRPRHVAIIGASGDPGKLTGRPVNYLRKYGFTGTVLPVNPRLEKIDDLTCYPDIQSLPVAPDVGLVLLGAERASQAVRALAQRGAGAAIVLASGFGESGAEGAKRQAELREAAGAMRVLGPNTIGLVNLSDRVMLSASGALEVGNLPVGHVSLVSQSGGILGALLSRAADRGIGFAKLVSTGNEGDLDSSDLLAHLVEDEQTKVLAVYMEGLRRPEAFRRVAYRAAALGKPIVVFKVGRSESGARAAVSHTGALAGADAMYDALFKQLGVIRAQSFSDLLDIPAALVPGRRMRGKRVAILTSTGGAGTLVADSCGLAGLDVPAPDAETAQNLAALQGMEGSSVQNPVDLTLAGLQPQILSAAMSGLLASESFDAAVVVVGSSALAQPNLVADAAVACQARSDKPLIAYVSPHAPDIVKLLNSKGIPTLTQPDGCAAVLTALAQPATMSPPAAAQAPVPHAPLPAMGGPLDEAESKRLFAAFGITSARELVAASPEEAGQLAQGLAGRLVVKILSRQIAHKSDVGGVRLGVARDEVAEVAARMQSDLARQGLPVEGFLVQEMVSGGIEFILGLTRDPQLGLALLLGAGGVAAELFKDTAIRLLPLSREDAVSMIDELKSAPLLEGYRGAPRHDVDALIEAILAFSRMGEQLGPHLQEAEINPLFILPEGQGVVAADGLAVLTKPEAEA